MQKKRCHSEHKKRRRNHCKIIDLFSGCGGLSLGFKNAGYEIMCGVDVDEKALETFKYNFPDSETINIDLSNKQKLSEFISVYKSKKPDVIIAGPPCQGFSLTGPRKFNDKRNSLYLAVFACVEKIKPQAFLIENVTGIAGLYKGAILKKIKEKFTALGYNVSAEILSSAEYGVPQIRKRMFIVGVKKKSGIFVFPQTIYSEKNYVSCKEAIGDLPSREKELGTEKDIYTRKPRTEYQILMRNGKEILYNHVATDHKDFVREVIAQVPEGGNYKDLPEGVGKSRRFNEAWTRYHSKKPSRTIDTGHRNHFHYHYNRVPTIRENARLQSFSDDFVFLGTKTQQNKHVGNAVPPLLGKLLAEKIAGYLKAKK